MSSPRTKTHTAYAKQERQWVILGCRAVSLTRAEHYLGQKLIDIINVGDKMLTMAFGHAAEQIYVHTHVTLNTCSCNHLWRVYIVKYVSCFWSVDIVFVVVYCVPILGAQVWMYWLLWACFRLFTLTFCWLSLRQWLVNKYFGGKFSAIVGRCQFGLFDNQRTVSTAVSLLESNKRLFSLMPPDEDNWHLKCGICNLIFFRSTLVYFHS